MFGISSAWHILPPDIQWFTPFPANPSSILDETALFKIAALFTHSAPRCLLLCFRSSSISFNIIWPTIYLFYLLLYCPLPQECKLNESKDASVLFTALPRQLEQCLTQRGSMNICWKNEASSPICSKTLFSSVSLNYHVGKRGKQEMKASS